MSASDKPPHLREGTGGPGNPDATVTSTPDTQRSPNIERSDNAQLEVGELLAGRFSILRFIARGGMGEVYEAHDTVLRIHVALKVIVSELADHPEALERFQREVLLARRVSHRNVCRMFEFYALEHHGRRLNFLTMELLGGVPLSEELADERRMTPGRALPILRQVAEALDAAHREGVVHRDLKPANVVLVPEPGAPEPRVVVTDFGIARALVRDASAEAIGTRGLVGTPQYMAPELLRSESPTPAADIYALGLLAYRMVTGRLPFQGETPWAAAAERLEHPPQAPRALVADLPSSWNRAILQALEREPAARPASGGAFVDALAPRSSRTWRLRQVAILTALGAAVVLVPWLVQRRHRQEPVGVRPPIAVLHLSYEGPVEAQWLAPGLSLLLEHGLEAAERKIRLVPWHRTAMARASLGIDPVQPLKAEDGQRLRTLLAVDRGIAGEIRCTGASDPACELTIPSLSIRDAFSSSDAIDASSRVSEAVRRALGLEIDGEERDWLAARRPPDVQVLRVLGEAMARYERFDLVGAAEQLESIGKLYPMSFDAHDIRSLFLQRLSLFTRAQRAAESARLASVTLSPSVRRRAAARVEWLGADRDHGVSVYQALHREFSDDLELALELSARLTSEACLAIVEGVAKTPGPAAADLRLPIRRADCVVYKDIAEAEQAVRSASVLATALGARRELAAIENQRGWVLSHQGASRNAIVAAFRHSIELSEAAGDLSRAAMTRTDFYSSGALTSEGIEENLKAVAELRRVQDRARVARILRNLGVSAALSGGDMREASRYLDEAEREFRALDEKPDWYEQCARAWVLEAAGDLRGTRRAFDRTRELPVTGYHAISYDIPFSVSDDETVDDFLNILERDLLTYEDRLEEAHALVEALMKATKRGAELGSYKGMLCRLKCLRRWDDHSHECFGNTQSLDATWILALEARCALAGQDRDGVGAVLASPLFKGSLASEAPLVAETRDAARAAVGNDPNAWHSLEDRIRRAAAIGQQRTRMSLELLRGQAAALAGRPGASKGLQRLAAEANERGFHLYARQAHELLSRLDRNPSRRP